MLQIGNVLVSLDVAERCFCCDPSKCLGVCCIEGDAGAPVTPQEQNEIEKSLAVVEPELAPRAVERIRQAGTAYRDVDGELVTQLVDGANCVFTCMAPGGVCQCALQKMGLKKPISCSLYPLRLTEHDGWTAVNYHRWKICRSAEKKGRELGIRLYQFLEGPLTQRFGAEWYNELKGACDAWNQQRATSKGGSLPL